MDFLRLLTGALGAVAMVAHAQSPTVGPAGGAGPTLKYESAFTGYRRYVDVEITSWSRANRDAAALGGHKGQAASEAVPPSSPMPGRSATTGAPEPARVPAAGSGNPQ